MTVLLILYLMSGRIESITVMADAKSCIDRANYVVNNLPEYDSAKCMLAIWEREA